jgi:hypothetical protein
MACEGTTAPASKAARLIRLRQMTAASKACEKAAARNADSQKRADVHGNVKVEPQVNDSPALVRQDLQQSISSLDHLPRPASAPAIVDDHTPHLPPPPPLPPPAAAASPPKPPRLIGRRHNVPPPLASPKPEQEDDYGTVDNGSPCIKLEVVDPPPPPKLEPQQSITSESLSNAMNHSFTAGSPQDSSSPPPLSFPSPRSPFHCVQLSNVVLADRDTVQSVSSFVEAPDQLKSFHKERFSLPQRPPPVEPSFGAFTVDSFAAPLIPFHALEASRQAMFRPENSIISGLVAFSHHQLNSCATNRDHVSVYPPERDEVICRGRSLRSSCMDGPMSLEDEKCVTTKKCSEAREEMAYGSSEMYRMEVESENIDRAILREKEFAELHVPEIIPWPEYVLMDQTGMESGLLGLDLSCENSGVYPSAFDFSAEAIDRDSCTSVMLENEHLSGDSEFLLRIQQSSTAQGLGFAQECVLLTERPELDYSMTSPHEPGPLSSPQEAHSLSMSSLLWRMDDASVCWDGQSSGSTETADLRAMTATGDGGECTSQDHEALWGSMDLTPLCMVA